MSLKDLVRALCGIGLLAAAAFIGAGVWFHLNYDAIIRIPFVLGSFTLGILLGASCLLRLLGSLRD